MCTVRSGLLSAMLLALSACGGGGGSGSTPPPPPPAAYNVSGYVAGLTGSGLTVSYNGGTPVAISRNGAFTSATGIASGTMYSVAIASQPTNPAQTCTVKNGSGSVGNANVTSVSVYCAQAVGEWAYVATLGSITLVPGVPSVPGTLSGYAIDANSGVLSLVAGSSLPTGPAVTALYVVPHSPDVWALSLGDSAADDQNVVSSLYVYSASTGTGLLTANPGNPFITLNGTASNPPGCEASGGYGSTDAVTFAPNGAFGYASNYASGPAANEATWVINLSPPGAPASLGVLVTGACNRPVTVDPSGQFAYYTIAVNFTGVTGGCCNYELVAATVDPTTDAVTPVAGTQPLPVGGGQGPATTDPFGRFLYLLDGDVVYEFTIDPASGALAPVAGSPISFPGASISVAMAPEGQFVYIAATDGVHVYAIDATTGALSAVDTVVPLQVGYGYMSDFFSTPMLIDPSGQYLYISASAGAGQQGIYAYTRDPNTGAPTLVPGSPFAVSAQSPPLPMTIID